MHLTALREEQGAVDPLLLAVERLFAATFGWASQAGHLARAVIVFTLVVFAFVFGIGAYLEYLGRGHGTEWKQVTCLPGHDDQPTIVGLRSDRIFLRFADGLTTGVDVHAGRSGPGSWLMAGPEHVCFDSVPPAALRFKGERCQPVFALSAPPGPSKQLVSTQENHACMHAAVLADETVWYWRSVRPSASDLILYAGVFGGIIGSFLGIATVWLLMLFIDRTSHSKSSIQIREGTADS
jgi:hypothetical protein